MVVLNVTNVFRLQVDHWSKTLYFLTTMAGGRHMGSYMPVRIFNLFYCVRRSMRCSTVLRALHQMKTGRGWQTFLASRSTSPLSFQSAPLAFRFELQNFPLFFFNTTCDNTVRGISGWRSDLQLCRGNIMWPGARLGRLGIPRQDHPEGLPQHQQVSRCLWNWILCAWWLLYFLIF